MQYKKTLVSAALATTVLGSYVPSEPWSTLTPSATYSGGATDHSTSFGIAIKTFAASSNSTSIAKRDAISQIGDGQIQATTATTAEAISQIDDGQIQATTATTAEAISQIDDGQIQATTATTPDAISQIDDGQIQATTAPAISQIDDGQIQATTAPAISQIDDGQIQATGTTTLAPGISQIDDGQIQATTTTKGASQISDGQVQATTSASSNDKSDPVRSKTCKADGTLSMTLNGGILIDGKGRIGSIVANRQFQFDGPPPQAGAIYAAGWSITPDGNLAIGEEDVFYQCLSGNFYNLYDESLGEQCHPVHLEVIDLIDC